MTGAMDNIAKQHDHLEIHALIDGGYVIREGRFNHGEDFDRGHAVWAWRQERAAFSTLEDALKWMAKQMINRRPEMN